MFKVKRRPKNQASKRISFDLIISHRILILAMCICVVFSLFVVRLSYLQIFSYDSYTQKKDDYTSITQYVSAPRGQIYDRKGRVLAKTVVSHNITYTSPNNYTQEDYRLYANRIVSVFDVDTDAFTQRDIKEAYMTYTSFKDPEDEEYNCNYLLTKKEREEYASGAWGSDAESIRYGKIYSRIKDSDLDEMSDSDLKECVIYQRMVANASTGQENVILQDVSDDDVAYLVEHKTEFPGFDVDFGGWKREYPYGETLSDVIGSVTTSTEGLPEEYADEYLQKGYQSNSPVGRFGLELQYNDLLAGTSEQSKITYDSQGLAKKTVIRSAQKGKDIVLSIDIDMQQALDDIIKTTLESNAGTDRRENFSTLFTSMMDPNTGQVIAMSGYQIDLETRKMTYFASGNYVSLVNPGSCVKGATVYMGLSEKVITPGQTFNDTVMNIAGQEFGSYEDHGVVNDVQALSVSSNVYMFHIAILLGGGTYVEGQPLYIEDISGTADTMRRYYSMFGLGNKTGLDVPNEVSGYMGVTGKESGMLLNYSIGQFDMYTPLQLLVYVSNIANNGTTYQPQLMMYAKEINSDEIYEINDPNVISKLPEENQQYLERVQEGFRSCVASGNCGDALKDLPFEVSAKTGTAEVNEWITANLVGYAPSSDPKIAFACSAPLSSINATNVAPNICYTDVMPQALTRYFELYPQ